MNYRTKTYIAGDWDGDKDAIEQLHTWNKSRYWNLSFVDAHELTQSKDSSLNCSIKKSLATRLDVSKTFILIVGEKTNTVRSGSCRYCNSYNSWTSSCGRSYCIDNRSYIEFECQKAVRDNLKIIVLYNNTSVDKYKCPEIIRNIGTHIAMRKMGYYNSDWDYDTIRNLLN